MRRRWVFKWNVFMIEKFSSAKRRRLICHLCWLMNEIERYEVLIHDRKLKDRINANSRVNQHQLCTNLVIRIWCRHLKSFDWKFSLRFERYWSLISFFIFTHSSHRISSLISSRIRAHVFVSRSSISKFIYRVSAFFSCLWWLTTRQSRQFSFWICCFSRTCRAFSFFWYSWFHLNSFDLNRIHFWFRFFFIFSRQLSSNSFSHFFVNSHSIHSLTFLTFDT